MAALSSTIRKARRRIMLVKLIHAMGPALTAAAVAALLLVGLDKALALGWPAWLLIGAPALLAFAGAMVWSVVRSPSSLVAASIVDHALELDDRLGSALALEREAADDPFAALAIHDGEQIASDVRVRDAAAVEFGGSWWAWPVVLASAIAVAIFVPAIDLADRLGEETRQAELAGAQAEAAREVAEARELVSPDETSVADFATPTELETLDELERQLSAGEADPDEARAKAASALSDAADSLERQAEQDDRALDSLQDQFEGLDDAAPESPLAKALSAGDFERARQLIEEQEQRLEELQNAERMEAAEDLESLADSLDESLNAAGETPPDPPSPTTDALRDLGVPEESIEELQQERDRDAIEETLREQGIEEPIAEDLADQLAEEQERRDAEEQAKRDAEQLRDALRDAADDLRSPQDETPQPPAESERDNPRDSQQGNDQSQPGDQSSPGEQQQESQDQQPGESESTPSSDEQPSDGAPQQTPTPGEQTPGQQPDPNQPQQQPDSSGDETPSESPQGAPDQSGEPSQQESPDGSESQPDGAPQSAPQGQTPTPDGPQSPTPQEGAQPSDDSDAPPGAAPNGEQRPDGDAPMGAEPSEGDGPSSGAGENGLERTRKLLDEFERRRQRANENRQSAEDARKKAREMLDRMSPEQREQMERWARELQRERPTPPPSRPSPSEDFDSRPVDMRPEESAPDRVIAQWFNPDADPSQPGEISRRAVDDRLQDAAKGAEQAVEEQSVHRRYSDIIKRYFENARKAKPAPQSEPD